MENNIKSSTKKKSWKNTKSLEEAKSFVDIGLLLKWKDMAHLKKVLTLPMQEDLMRHFAKRLCERADERLASEMIVESVLIWFANNLKDSLIVAFLKQIFEEPHAEKAALVLVEITLTGEPTESGHDAYLFSLGVGLICELGIAIHEYSIKAPGELVGAHKIISHITTFLLSVSNTNNTSIRLSLLHYFGHTAKLTGSNTSLNRVMSRFGHTVIDHLFQLLFEKKSEAIALQYLSENLPYAFFADTNCQRIMHETFKFYLLKQPGRFAVFLETLADELLNKDSSEELKSVFIQHIGALYSVTSEVHHRGLAKDLVSIMERFSPDLKKAVLNQIVTNENIRESFKDLARFHIDVNPPRSTKENVLLFKNSRRGRRPIFVKQDNIGIFEQINLLGKGNFHVKVS